MREFFGEKNQKIRIGPDIVITILKICAGRVRCVLEAPKGMELIREPADARQFRRKRSQRNHSARVALQRLVVQ